MLVLGDFWENSCIDVCETSTPSIVQPNSSYTHCQFQWGKDVIMVRMHATVMIKIMDNCIELLFKKHLYNSFVRKNYIQHFATNVGMVRKNFEPARFTATHAMECLDVYLV